MSSKRIVFKREKLGNVLCKKCIHNFETTLKLLQNQLVLSTVNSVNVTGPMVKWFQAGINIFT